MGTSIPGGKWWKLSGTDCGVSCVWMRGHTTGGGGNSSQVAQAAAQTPSPTPLSPLAASDCAEPQDRRPSGKAPVPGPRGWIHLRSLNRGHCLGIQIVTFSILTGGETTGPKPEW